MLNNSPLGDSKHNFFAKAPVSGFARSFVSGKPIADASIKVVGWKDFAVKTDQSGKFGPIWCTIGSDIILRLERPGTWWSGYRTIQTANIKVPAQGINHADYLQNISFQVPSNIAFTFFSWAMGIKEEQGACQIAVTVTPPNTTMDDLPQGEAEVEVSLKPDPAVQPYYLGIIPYIHKTNFFWRQAATSLDGGVIFPNVPAGEYTLVATKGDRKAQITITASPDAIVNASPPYSLVI